MDFLYGILKLTFIALVIVGITVIFREIGCLFNYYTKDKRGRTAYRQFRKDGYFVEDAAEGFLFICRVGTLIILLWGFIELTLALGRTAWL